MQNRFFQTIWSHYIKTWILIKYDDIDDPVLVLLYKHSVLLFIGAFLNNIATKFHKLLSQHQWFCLFEQEIIDNIATRNQNSHSL